MYVYILYLLAPCYFIVLFQFIFYIIELFCAIKVDSEIQL